MSVLTDSLRHRKSTAVECHSSTSNADIVDDTTPQFNWKEKFAERSVWPRRLRFILAPIFGVRVLGIIARTQLMRPIGAVSSVIARVIGRDSVVGRWLPIHSVDDFSPEFLTRQLRETGLLQGDDTVASLTVESMGTMEVTPDETESSSHSSTPSSVQTKKRKQAVQGQMGAMRKIIITYAGSDAARIASYPSSFVVKQTPDVPALQTFASLFGMFEGEAFEFSGRNLDLFSRMDHKCVSIPRSYGARFYSWAGKGWILMEDMLPAHLPDGTEKMVSYKTSGTWDGNELPLARVHTVIDGLVSFHATTEKLLRSHFQHSKDGTPHLSPLLGYPFPLRGDGVHAGFFNWIKQESDQTFLFFLGNHGWNQMHSLLEKPMGEELKQVGEWLLSPPACGLWTLQAMWLEWWQRRPYFFLIAHGDVHVGNCLFDGRDRADSPRPFVLFDLQVMRYFPRTFDLSYFLQGNLPSKTYGEQEEPLLRRYFDQIREIQSMSDEEREAAWTDFCTLYQTTMLFHIYTVIGLGTTIVAQTHQAHNATSGETPISFREFPIGRSLLETVARMEAIVKRHKLHLVVQKWR